MKSTKIEWCDSTINPVVGCTFICDGITFVHVNSPFNYEWIIIGAETGNRKDKIVPKKVWADNLVSYAKRNRIPVFMKESMLPIMGEENMLREFPNKLKREQV